MNRPYNPHHFTKRRYILLLFLVVGLLAFVFATTPLPSADAMGLGSSVHVGHANLSAPDVANAQQSKEVELNITAPAQNTFTPPAQQSVLRFDGEEIATAPVATALNLGNQFTMESWVYVEATRPYAFIMGKPHTDRSADPYYSYVLGFSPDGSRFEFVQSTDLPGSYSAATAPTAAPLYTWTHIAATLSAGMMRLFINGQEVVSAASPGAPNNSTVPFAIGAGANSAGGIAAGGFTGALRQVRVWNRALTASELTVNAGRYLSGSESGLVAYWPLDDGVGQSARDLGPNGLTLNLGFNSNTESVDPRWVHTTILNSGPYFSIERFQIPPTNYFETGRLFDLNSDGKLDVLVTHESAFGLTPSPLQPLRNDGQGHFSDATADVLGNQAISTEAPRDFAIADFNGDGRKDMFIADHGKDVPPFLGGQSRILIQTPDGGLVDETNYRLPLQQAFTHSVTAGDIDYDGDIDIYMGNICCGVGPEIYINDGTGHFSSDITRLPPSLLSKQTAYAASRFVDVNKDGHVDLVLGMLTGSIDPTVDTDRDAILVNDGTGHFRFAPSHSMPLRYGGRNWLTVAIEVSDFDNDGWPDLLMAENKIYREPRLQLLLNNRNGTFRDASDRIPQTWPRSSTSDTWLPWAMTADFNGDGWMDFVTSGASVEPHLYLNTGIGQFIDASETLRSLEIVGFISTMLPGDLDKDGDVDMFAIGSGGNYFVLRNLKPYSPTQGCSFTLLSTSKTFNSSSGTGSVNVTAGNDCQWMANSNVDWMSVTNAGNLISGNADVNYSVAVNPSANSRVGTMIIAGQTFTVTQAGDPPASNTQFSFANYNTGEGDGGVVITVNRTGDASGSATVDYATSDGTAVQSRDYEVATGTLSFASGEASKTFAVLVADDAYVEGNETFSLKLSNANGAPLGGLSQATVTITDNDTAPPTTNPLDNADAQFFVRQHYYDFLARVPDAGGFSFWTSQITGAGSDPVQFRNKRIDVSNAFFYELEYQQTGSYVYRMYRVAFGNKQPFPNPDNSKPAESIKLPSYAVFSSDRARVIGGTDLATGQLALATAFVLRPEFTSRYPLSLDGPGFVDVVLSTIKNDFGVDFATQRAALIALYNSGGRAAVIYRLADDNLQTNPINNRALIDEEYNRAFVATQYFGYLRRDPDIDGYLFWLGQVHGAALRDVPKQHAMVCSFITSIEYQLRFSSVVTHSNAECP